MRPEGNFSVKFDRLASAVLRFAHEIDYSALWKRAALLAILLTALSILLENHPVLLGVLAVAAGILVWASLAIPAIFTAKSGAWARALYILRGNWVTSALLRSFGEQKAEARGRSRVRPTLWTMNSSLDSVSSVAQRFAALPLRVLALLDYFGLKFEYRGLVKQAAAHNAWFVHREGETLGPEPIEAILQRLAAGESNLAIIHASALAEPDPEWQILSHQCWRDDLPTAVVWVVSFWMLAVLLGWLFIGLIQPLSLRIYCEVVYFLALVVAGFRFALAPPISPNQAQPPSASDLHRAMRELQAAIQVSRYSR